MQDIKTVSTSDDDAVIATVSKYVEGLKVGSVDSVADAFQRMP
jgi:hypothetical protein